jgi:hypothetical protein
MLGMAMRRWRGLVIGEFEGGEAAVGVEFEGNLAGVEGGERARGVIDLRAPVSPRCTPAVGDTPREGLADIRLGRRPMPVSVIRRRQPAHLQASLIPCFLFLTALPIREHIIS